jgi:hypothetical protein
LQTLHVLCGIAFSFLSNSLTCSNYFLQNSKPPDFYPESAESVRPQWPTQAGCE